MKVLPVCAFVVIHGHIPPVTVCQDASKLLLAVAKAKAGSGLLISHHGPQRPEISATLRDLLRILEYLVVTYALIWGFPKMVASNNHGFSY